MDRCNAYNCKTEHVFCDTTPAIDETSGTDARFVMVGGARPYLNAYPTGRHTDRHIYSIDDRRKLRALAKAILVALDGKKPPKKRARRKG